VPRGCNVGNENSQWALKVVNNIYGQKQAGRVWYKYLVDKLVNELGFQHSKYDPCVLWNDGCLIVVYTDDTLITGSNEEKIDQTIADIGKLFNITSNDVVDDFLGVNIDRRLDGTINMTQGKLIQSILDDLGIKDDTNTKTTPALSTKILQQHLDSPEFNEPWHYRSVIGKLNFLEKSTRPDIAYAVHQCARFASNPRYEHGKAVKHIGRYLLATKDKGIICKPSNEPFACYADADYAGNYEYEATDDKATARSRTGYVIKYGNMPIVWGSKLQTECALSSTESEYISLSTSLRDAIPMIDFLQELTDVGFDFNIEHPTISCKAFEDNEGALEMARSPKFRPRTKHINVKYHHFHDSIESGKIHMLGIDTKEQQADILTKPLDEYTFLYIRKLLMGW
jgi:hypothetical protein